MISLPTPTKFPISLSLTDEQREYISDLIATRYLDQMDSRDLERFFFDVQMDYLKEYTDDELVNALEDVTDEEEFDSAVNYANWNFDYRLNKFRLSDAPLKHDNFYTSFIRNNDRKRVRIAHRHLASLEPKI